MPEILQQPQSPDEIARIAGRSIYGTSVGLLRRVELYRLGNAWGFKFPVGATKDYMLPFFIDLESKGIDPLRPPKGNLDTLVKARACEFTSENHSETPPPEEQTENKTATVMPAPKSSFEEKLEKSPMHEIRKLCKLRGVAFTPRDRKQDLIARIVAASEGNDLEQDAPTGC